MDIFKQAHTRPSKLEAPDGDLLAGVISYGYIWILNGLVLVFLVCFMCVDFIVGYYMTVLLLLNIL